MDFITMQNTVYRLMRDPLKTKFDIQFIKNWINEGERIYCAKTQYNVQKSTSLQTVPTQVEYSLPADFKSIIGAHIGTLPRKLAEIDITKTSIPSVGPSSNYYIRNGFIGLWPTPNNYENLTLYYDAIGGALTNDLDVSIVPVDHHLAPVWFACYMCSVEADDNRVQYFWQNFQDMVQSAIIQNAQSSEENPVAGESTRGYINPQAFDMGRL